jgi:hypothetical protein
MKYCISCRALTVREELNILEEWLCYACMLDAEEQQWIREQEELEDE